MTTYRQDPLLNGVIANLAAGTSVAIGDAWKPEGAGWTGNPGASAFVGYLVVHSFSNRFGGSIDEPFDDAAPTVSISAYGATRTQATQLSDQAHASLLDTPITITGRHVMLVEPLDDSATDRLDEVQPPVWQAVTRYRIHTTTP